MTGLRALYVSYDGVTDPLGRSQVLPYLTGLAKRGHRITLVSFEKSGSGPAEKGAVRAICSNAGIDWHPLAYHKQPPILSTIYDVFRMRRQAAKLHRREAFEVVHCRSYLAAMVGLAMKRRHGTRFLFDMRGFWADERVEGRIWNLRNPVFKAVFRYFKRREAEFFAEADHIVSLTVEGKRVLLGRSDRAEDGPPITIIPCCADFDHFAPVDAERRDRAREMLGIPSNSPVLGYIGSLGGNYLLDEMLAFFRAFRDKRQGARFLLVTRHDPGEVCDAAAKQNITKEEIIVRSAERDEVPVLARAADLGIAFKAANFSSKACCPTKIGELLALGIPVVANSGVGDVDEIIERTGAGVVVRGFDRAAYAEALDQLEALGAGQFDMGRWREQARRWFDLERGIDRYDAVYRQLTAAA